MILKENLIVKIVTRNHIESDYFFNSTKVFEIVDSNTVKDSYYVRVSDDFDIENSPFELINQIESYYIILANNISKNPLISTPDYSLLHYFPLI